MSNFINFISLLVSFLIALVGTFFKCIKEDETGKRVYSARGRPLLTNQGKLILVLLFLSFGTSLWLAWDAAQTNKKLTDQLNGIKKENYNGYQSVLSEQRTEERAALDRQKHLIDLQEETGQQIARNLEHTASLLEQTVVGRLSNVNSLGTILYFEGAPRLKDAKFRPTADAFMSLAFCSRWIRQARLTIPAGRDIAFFFSLIGGNDGTCSIKQEFHWGSKNSPLENSAFGEPVSWNAYNPDLSLVDSFNIRITLDRETFRTMNPTPSATPAMSLFVPDGDAVLIVQPTSDKNFEALARDLDELLPRRIGIRVLPNEVGTELLTVRRYDREKSIIEGKDGFVSVRFKGTQRVPISW
jgi:hypothetical protein